jgi:hypothetical protein
MLQRFFFWIDWIEFIWEDIVPILSPHGYNYIVLGPAFFIGDDMT